MGIRFRCHHCEHELHVKDFQAGKRGRCPACQGRFRIPLSDADFSLDPDSQASMLPDAGSNSNSAQAVSSKNASPSAPDGNQPISSKEENSPSHPSSSSLSPKPKPAAANPSLAPGEPATVPQKSRSRRAKTDRKRRVEDEKATEPKPAEASTSGQRPRAEAQKKHQREQAASVRNKAHTADVRGPSQEHPSEGLQDESRSEPGKLNAGDAPLNTPQSDLAHWYVRPPAGGQYGPASTELLNQWVSERRVTADSLVWRDGWADWQLAANVLTQFQQLDAQNQSESPSAPPPAEPTTGHANAVSPQPTKPAQITASRSPGSKVAFATDEASTRNPLAATAAPISGAFSQPPTPPDASPSRPSLGERNRLERRRRKRRNYIIMLSVLTVLAIGLIAALIVALVVQN